MRRQEHKRIELENQGIAQRLFSNQSVLSKKQLIEDHKRQDQYRKMIQRVGKHRPSLNGRYQVLPPLPKEMGNRKQSKSVIEQTVVD